MKTHLVFSAGSFIFGMDLQDVDHIEKSHSDIELKGKQVQNFHTLFGGEGDRAEDATCWIVKKDGNALGVNRILGLGEVTHHPMPSFLHQNLKFKAIDGLGEYQATIVFLLKHREG